MPELRSTMNNKSITIIQHHSSVTTTNYRTGKENAETAKAARCAANTSIRCCFTGLADGGALGPMPWGMAPGIPAAMGTLWAVTGPRVSIALGSRPAGKKHLMYLAQKAWKYIQEMSLTTIKMLKTTNCQLQTAAEPKNNSSFQAVYASLIMELLNMQQQEIKTGHEIQRK